MSNLYAMDSRRYKIGVLCGLFGVSRQAYYKHSEDAVMADVAGEGIIVEFIKSVRAKDPGMGGVKIWHMYQREFDSSFPMGRDRFLDIIDANGLKLRRKMRKPRTTDSSHGLPLFKNLVKSFIPTRPNQLWVSDITYIVLWNKDGTYTFCYLSIILDAYTEEIVGWSIGPTLETAYPVKALRKALRRLDGIADVSLIHHSDRGCQYASREYVSMLRKYGIQISMTENGDPKQNAQAERINSTIKNELLMGMRFRNIEEAKRAVSKAIFFYNTERPHMSIDMLTPAEAAERKGEIAKRWHSYRENAIKRNSTDLQED